MVAATVIALALALAYLPMKLLMLQITRNVKEMIERQRERRQAPRTTLDRRTASSPGRLDALRQAEAPIRGHTI